MKNLNKKPLRWLKRIPIGVLLGFTLILILPPLVTAAPGDLDPSFGTGGKVTTNVFPGAPSGNVIRDMTVQPDEKILAVGSAADYIDPLAALVRYNPDGTLDSTFGIGGKVIENFTEFAFFFALALQSDSKIVSRTACRT